MAGLGAGVGKEKGTRRNAKEAGKTELRKPLLVNFRKSLTT